MTAGKKERKEVGGRIKENEGVVNAVNKSHRSCALGKQRVKLMIPAI